MHYVWQLESPAPWHELEYIGDNTPLYVMAIPALLELFPDARFVHMMRDPRDIVCSITKMKFGAEDLSAAAEDFDIRWGWTNGTIDTNTVEGAWISYQREENSGGWTLKTNNGATTTTTNCGAAIAADTWYDIEIIYYPYGEVTVFIDGTRYTTTSTLPDAITTTPLLQIDKDNGTTARILYYSAAELTYVNVSD